MQRIEGLSIGLSLDTLKVDSGLTNLKRKLSLVNSEMKANLSAFDRSENSIDKYQVKIDGLNKKLDVQRKVTENARKHYEKMVKEHGEGSAEAEKAARAYNNEVAKLNSLERQIKDVTSQMKEFQRQQKIQNSILFKAGDSLIKFGSGLKSMSDKMKDVGKSLTTKITTPAVGAATALGGIALVKGFDRLVGIDTARAKLTGLGHDAKGVEKIMESALESVKGTSFGMDEAATTAANAVAAGVEEGKELTRYLSLTGDAAAIAGTSMGEMGSILNKVKTSNKAYNGELQQLSDRGLPVYQWLAEEAGVAADAVFDLASDGQISSEMLMDAIEKNIGGAAKKMGETSFTAGIANMWAAVGRLGASFLDAGGKGGGFFSQLKPLIADFTDRIDSMGGIAEKAGAKLGEMFSSLVDKIKTMKESYDNMSPTMQDFIKKAALIGSAIAVGIGPALSVLGTFGGFVAKVSTNVGKLSKSIAEAGGFLKWLRSGFAVLTGPIGLTVAAIAGLTTGFIAAYNKSETFREIVHGVKDAIVQAYQKVKEFLTTNPQFLAFIDSVKQGFSSAKQIIMDALGKAIDFGIEKIGQIKKFWDSDGQQLLQAFRNVFSGIWKVAKPILDGLVAAFEFAFPFIKALVQSVIGNIKGIIDGGLNFIMGLAKTFSGLFTGDFSKMWEGIKQLFSGAIQFVWNFVQLTFFGKLLKGGMAFIKSFAGFFSSMWNGIKKVFSTVISWVVNFVKNRFTAMRNTVNTITTGIRTVISNIWNGIKKVFSTVISWVVNFVKTRFTAMRNTVRAITTAIRTVISNIWNGIKNFFGNVIRGIVDFVRGRFNAMRDTIRSIFNKVREITRNVWNGIKDRIINPVKNVVSGIRNRFNDMKNRVTDIFKGVRDNVRDYVDRMVNTVKGMPKRMGDGIKKMAGKVGGGVKAVANKMMEMLGKGVNGVIGGVNWVLEKIGVKTRIKEWKVPQYAKGTDGHPGGLAVVGDGKGANAGSELIQTPDGKQYLSPAKPTLVDLPKGTHVLPAYLTKQLTDVPAYAWGTLKDAWNKGKKAVTSIKDTALDVWSYISNPKKLLNKALEVFGVETPDMPGILKKVGTGAFKKVKDSFVGFIKNKIEDFGGGDVPTSGSGVKRWKGVATRALMMTGQFTPSNLNRLLYQMQTESGGNPKAINLWDINAKRGTPSKGLMQVIDPTFRAYAHPGYNKNIWDPLSNILASIRYAVSRYGSLARAYRGVGYETGGRIATDGLYRLAEGGWPEFVIPTDPSRRTDAQKLLALAGREIAGNKRPHQLPRVSGQGAGNAGDWDAIQALSDKVDKLTMLMVDLLGIQREQLEAITAGQTIVANGRELARTVRPELDRENYRRGRNPRA